MKAKFVRVNPELFVLQNYNRIHLGLLDSYLNYGEEEGTLFHEIKGNYYTFEGLARFISIKHPELFEPVDREENEFPPFPIDPGCLKGITLMSHQTQALVKMLLMKRGIIKIGTGGGKSEVNLAFFRHLLDNKQAIGYRSGIVLVPSIYLAYDMYNRAIKYGFSSREICIYGDGEKNLGGDVVIVVLKSAIQAISCRNGMLYNRLLQTTAVVADEAHTLRSEKHSEIILSAMNAKYKLGFTATPFYDYKNPISNIGDARLLGILNSIILEVSSKYLVEVGLNSKVITFFKNTPGKALDYKGNVINKMRKFINRNEKRNRYVAEVSRYVAGLGFKVFITVNEHKQGLFMMECLPDQKVMCKFGGETTFLRDRNGKVKKYNYPYEIWSKKFESDEIQILIGSPSLFQGMNMPDIGFVIVASGGRSTMRINQKRGRGARAKKIGPNQVFLMDLNDNYHVDLQRHSSIRRELYEKEGSEIIEDENTFWNIVLEHAREVNEHTTQLRSQTGSEEE